MWERGLKLLVVQIIVTLPVAPHVGAWIETSGGSVFPYLLTVAPHVGAWIETIILTTRRRMSRSLPMWERGLKLNVIVVLV